jgi:hypothetical protein
MEQLEVLTDESLTITTKASTALGIAQALKIETDADRLRAGDFLKIVKTLQKEVKADREDERVAGQRLLDAIRAGRNKHLLPLEQAEEMVKKKVLVYLATEERKRQVEQDRINAELLEVEQTRILAEAQTLEDGGAPEAAAEVRAQEPEVVPVIVPNLAPKVEGQHTLTLWKCRVLSLETLVKAVAEGRASIAYLQVNQVYANSEVKRLKGDFVVEGMESYTEKSLASKSW